VFQFQQLPINYQFIYKMINSSRNPEEEEKINENGAFI
jgi:hypothetical protein